MSSGQEGSDAVLAPRLYWFRALLLKACADEGVVAASGKMEVLDRLLRKLKRRGHRVVLFSQVGQAVGLLMECNAAGTLKAVLAVVLLLWAC